MGTNNYIIQLNKDTIGKKFGRLLVLEQVDSHKHIYDKTKKQSFHSRFRCLCDCGNDKYIAYGPRLRKGITFRCSECGFKSRYNGKSEIERLFRSEIVNNTRANKLGYDLSLEDFKTLVLGECVYCGSPPSTNKYYFNKVLNIKDLVVNGIDRVNSKIGYYKQNCVSCCKRCNYMKSDLTLEEFKIHITKIYNYYGGKKI